MGQDSFIHETTDGNVNLPQGENLTVYRKAGVPRAAADPGKPFQVLHPDGYIEPLGDGSGLASVLTDGTSIGGDGLLGNEITSLLWERGAGVNSIEQKNSGSVASGENAIAAGQNNSTASGDGSFALGDEVIASGRASNATGDETIASGPVSHAEGFQTTASGDQSHSEGNNTTSSGINSHAEGLSTTSLGEQSHAEGSNTDASGNNSHAEGSGGTASGDNSHVEGSGGTASGINAHSEGSSTVASAPNSHSQGLDTIASGEGSHSAGKGNGGNLVIASGDVSFNHSTAAAIQSDSEGLSSAILGGTDNNISAAGVNAFIGGGNGNLASGANSFVAGGTTNIASGANSFAGGTNAEAIGVDSHASGQGSGGFKVKATGDQSFNHSLAFLADSDILAGSGAILGGFDNNIGASGFNAFIGGGYGHNIDADAGAIIGGVGNVIAPLANGSVCISGVGNTAGNSGVVVLGGNNGDPGRSETAQGYTNMYRTRITGIQEFADDAAALAGGLTSRALYKTTAGGSSVVKVVA